MNIFQANVKKIKPLSATDNVKIYAKVPSKHNKPIVASEFLLYCICKS